MMTPQEVSGATFAKAVMGGYNMAAVDEFLDKVTEDYTGLYKENNALKAKMKVLVERIEEYRQVEDSLRGTLLAAQKMADQMVKDAEVKRDSILAEAERLQKNLTAEAEKAASARSEELRQEIANQERLQREVVAETERLIAAEKERLNQAKTATVDFVAASKALCQSQLAMLERLPEIKVEPVAAPVVVREETETAVEEPEETAQEPEMEQPAEEEHQTDAADDVMAAIAALTSEGAFRGEEQAEEPEEEAAGEDDEMLSLWKDDDDMDVTRVIRLDQLQFGRNYNNED